MRGGSHGLITLARTRAPWADLRGRGRSAVTTEESGFLSVSLAQLSESRELAVVFNDEQLEFVGHVKFLVKNQVSELKLCDKL